MKKILTVSSIGLVLILIGFFIVFKNQNGIFFQNIPFANSCMVDSDCRLQKLEFECKQTCPDYIVDYAEKKYVSVNINNFQAFSRQWHTDKCKNTKFDPPMCPFVMPQYENTDYKAVCKNNVCQKINENK